MTISQNNCFFILMVLPSVFGQLHNGYVCLVCLNTATAMDSEKVWEIFKSVGLKLCVSIGYHYMPLTKLFF